MTDNRDKAFIKSQLTDARRRLQVSITEISKYPNSGSLTTQALRNLRKVVDEAIEAGLARDIYAELDHD